MAADTAIRRIVTHAGGNPVAIARDELRPAGENRAPGPLRALIDATEHGPPPGLTASERRNLRTLLDELAKGRLLLAQVPYKEGTRQVIKLAYNAELKTGRAGGGRMDKVRFQANHADPA